RGTAAGKGSRKVSGRWQVSQSARLPGKWTSPKSCAVGTGIPKPYTTYGCCVRFSPVWILCSKCLRPIGCVFWSAPMTFLRRMKSVLLGLWHTTQYSTRLRRLPCTLNPCEKTPWHEAQFDWSTTARRGTTGVPSTLKSSTTFSIASDTFWVSGGVSLFVGAGGRGSPPPRPGARGVGGAPGGTVGLTGAEPP